MALINYARQIRKFNINVNSKLFTTCCAYTF